MKYLMLIVSSLLLNLFGFSQENNTDTTKQKQLYVVTKNDGAEYIGYILSDDGREILLETEKIGKVYINKSEIKSIVKIEDQKEVVFGEYQSEGPFTTRYAFTTNALPIKKGENYALINLYGPEVHFAVSDNFNIGIMSTWIASPMVLATKYSFKTKNEKVNLSLGALIGTSGYLNNFRGFGGLYFGNITIGTRKKNISLSAGYGHLNLGFKESIWIEGTYQTNEQYYYPQVESINTISPLVHGPIISVAGIAKIGSKASFVFDSMFGFFNSKNYNQVTTTTLIDPVFGYSNPNPPYEWIEGTPGLYQHVVEHKNTQQLAMFLMPGMRFQTKENRAFQVSLAGVAVFRLKGFDNYSNDSYSFPFPMCTWFFRF